MRPAAATVSLLTLGIVAGLLAVQCTNQPSTLPGARPAPQLCVSGPTQPSDRFSLAHGCITYSDGSEIWAVDPNHPANRISLGPSRGMTLMAWSRDGSRLLLTEVRNAGTAQEAQDLYVMNADASQTRLTNDGHNGDGSFSPDGARVVFSRTDDGLYVVDAKGGVPRLIAKSYLAWWLGTPAWSPDGSRIAYTVYLEGGPAGLTYEIWTVSPDGTNPRRLLDLGKCRASCAGGLAWSPDGSMLAFHSAQGTGQPALDFSIYVVRADGSGLHRINGHSVQPSWSPDGSRIAFTQLRPSINSGSDTSKNGEVFTMARDGSNVTLVLKGHVVFSPTWPPAGLAWNPVVGT